jgi:hypothetical protein
VTNTVTSMEQERNMNKQLTIYDSFGVSEHESCSLTGSVSEQKQAAIQRYLDKGDKEPIGCVNRYYTGRSSSPYFRLSYRMGRKIKHCHIPGGNAYSPLAQYRAQQIENLIARGADLGEMMAAINTYRDRRR